MESSKNTQFKWHTHTRTIIHTQRHTHTHTYTHTHTHTRTHRNTHTHSHIVMRRLQWLKISRWEARLHTHSNAHACTNTHTHTLGLSTNIQNLNIYCIRIVLKTDIRRLKLIFKCGKTHPRQPRRVLSAWHTAWGVRDRSQKSHSQRHCWLWKMAVQSPTRPTRKSDFNPKQSEKPCLEILQI